MKLKLKKIQRGQGANGSLVERKDVRRERGRNGWGREGTENKGNGRMKTKEKGSEDAG